MHRERNEEKEDSHQRMEGNVSNQLPPFAMRLFMNMFIT